MTAYAMAATPRQVAARRARSVTRRPTRWFRGVRSAPVHDPEQPGQPEQGEEEHSRNANRERAADHQAQREDLLERQPRQPRNRGDDAAERPCDPEGERHVLGIVERVAEEDRRRDQDEAGPEGCPGAREPHGQALDPDDGRDAAQPGEQVARLEHPEGRHACKTLGHDIEESAQVAVQPLMQGAGVGQAAPVPGEDRIPVRRVAALVPGDPVVVVEAERYCCVRGDEEPVRECPRELAWRSGPVPLRARLRRWSGIIAPAVRHASRAPARPGTPLRATTAAAPNRASAP